MHDNRDPCSTLFSTTHLKQMSIVQISINEYSIMTETRVVSKPKGALTLKLLCQCLLHCTLYIPDQCNPKPTRSEI